MKKLIAILLSVLMLVCFAACTNTEDPTEPSSDDATNEEIVTDEVTEENVSDEATSEEATSEEDTAVADDSAAVSALSAVWESVVADEALVTAFGAASSEELAGFFAGGDTFAMGTPAAYSLADKEVLTFTFGVPADKTDAVVGLATIMHAMNGNNLTAAAYELAEDADAVDFANALKDGIKGMQFLCGAPEQLVIAEADGIVIAAFGGADIINAFNTALSANGTVLVNDAIA